MPGWQMGRRVALCQTCHDASSNGAPSDVSSNDSALELTLPGDVSTTDDQGMQQFEFDCASRGFHVYRDAWRPVRGEALEIENDYGNVHDPFALSLNVQTHGRRLLAYNIVGHIPREISRFCHYFLNYGGSLEARVRNTQYRRSPIPRGGLEIPIRLIVKKENADNQVFEEMKGFLEEYYLEPDQIAKCQTQYEVESWEDQIDFEEEHGPEENEKVADHVDSEDLEENSEDDVIVID